MQETLMDEIDELDINIEDLEYYISTLNRPDQFLELAQNRNVLHSYRCAREVYSKALERIEECSI